MDNQSQKPPPRRQENPIFTVWVHVGYTILVISMIGWMVYMEFFM
ncbi:putative membrane protein YukC [Nitrospina gracilis]|nr:MULTISPECIES: hypothetical protein [Nitrospina]MCF8722736.1 putative membrane protein YukC [Nitrospina sp. Nb-3]